MAFIDNTRSLISRVSNAVKRFAGRVPVDSREQKQDEFQFAPILSAGIEEIFSHQSNKYYERVRTVSDLYFNDARVGGAIDKICAKATQVNDAKRSFEIDVFSSGKREQKKVKEQIELLFDRLGIHGRVKTFLRNALIEGVTYYRIALDESLTEIIGFDKVKGPRSGFILERYIENDIDGWIHVEVKTQKVVNFFYWWEIIPFEWNIDDESGLGIPFGLRADKYYSREDESSKFLALARLSRAWKRLAYKIDAANLAEFKRIVNEIRLSKPKDIKQEPFSDVYHNSDVRVLDESSASLWNIHDIEHHEKNLITALGVPKALYTGDSKDVPNRSVMDVLYDEFVSSIVIDAEKTIAGTPYFSGLLGLITVQLWLIGKTPEFTQVNLIFPSKYRVTENEIRAIDLAFDKGGLSRQTYLAKIANVDYFEELEKRKAEMEMEREFDNTEGNRSVEPKAAEGVVVAARKIAFSRENGSIGND